MCKRLVCLCHTVSLFFLLERSTGIVRCIDYLGCKTVCHGTLAALSGKHYHPAKTQSLTSFCSYLQRYLIGRSTYTASLNLKYGHYVFKSFNKSFESILTSLRLNACKCVVNDLLGDSLLAVKHYVVDKLGNKLRLVKRIRQNISLGYTTSSRHCTSLLH